jgi:alpha-tubulin suppressor-like RCC1 family protein
MTKLLASGLKIQTYFTNTTSQETEPILVDTSTFVPTRADHHKPPKIVHVACGDRFILFLTHEGRVYGSGLGKYGLLGEPSDTSIRPPVELVIGNNEIIKSVGCGRTHIFYLTYKNELYSAGRNYCGALGYDPGTPYATANLVPFRSDLYTIQKVICGLWHTVFMVKDKQGRQRIMACGANSDSQITGFQQRSDIHEIPNHFFTGHKIIDVSCGGMHTCFLTNEGRVFSVGYNNERQCVS